MHLPRRLTLGSGLLIALAMLIASLTPATQRSEAASTVSVTGLHVAGNQIVNSQGQALLLHGVNRSSAEYACMNGWGVFVGPADATEVQAMLSWNIDVVRITLNEDCWLGINGVDPTYAGANYQNAVANYVALLNQANIVTILNLAWSAAGTTRATSTQPMADRDHSPAFWASVATRFKNNSAVMFEPYNEPRPDSGNDTTAAWTCWRDGGTCPGVPFTAAGMQELVTAIRNTGATNPIILDGNDWASSLTQLVSYLPNDPAHQLIAGWHSYGDGLYCQTLSCWDTLLVSVLQTAPILATEIGEFDCGHSYIDQVMNFLDSQGQGYLTWSWGPFSCTADPALLTDWSGTATQTYGSGYQAHIRQIPNAVGGTAPTSTPTPMTSQTPTRTTPPASTATSVPAATATRTPTHTPSPVATGTLPAVSAYRSTVLADNPVAYWRLDETSGTTASDQQGGYTGTFVGSPSLDQPGALTADSDPSAGFSGNGQYVSVPFSPALNTPAFSAEAWISPTGGAGTYRGVMASRYYPNGWVLYASASNTWEFWVNNGASIVTVSGGAVALNTWTHLVVTFDGTTARLYVNGALAGSAAVSSYNPQTTSALTVGQSEPGSGFWFPGRIDEPAVYALALGATRVQAHFLAGIGTGSAPTPTLITPSATTTSPATPIATSTLLKLTPTQQPTASATAVKHGHPQRAKAQ